MTMDDDSCYLCGAPATLLCDFAVGREKAGTVPARKVDGRYYPAYDACCIHTSRVFTCDRPMCGACATSKGALFICGTPEVSEVVTQDYCRDHAGPSDVLAPVITEAQADAIRSRMRLRAFSPPP
jgi:hypothetical protein